MAIKTVSETFQLKPHNLTSQGMSKVSRIYLECTKSIQWLAVLQLSSGTQLWETRRLEFEQNTLLQGQKGWDMSQRRVGREGWLETWGLGCWLVVLSRRKAGADLSPEWVAELGRGQGWREKAEYKDQSRADGAACSVRHRKTGNELLTTRRLETQTDWVVTRIWQGWCGRAESL